MGQVQRLPASFRDPAGFVYEEDKTVFRQINPRAFDDYELLMGSGLYAALTRLGLLLTHEETGRSEEKIIIRPEQLPFVSYPYEWCFEQYKDAARALLNIQEIAIAHGMMLKDATAYNMQFLHGRPVLIDTLSFTRLEEKRPWAAYRQFCQHFLAPLALMALRDIRLSQLMLAHMDGVPLDLASALLPVGSRLNLGLFMHVHMHAAAQARYEHTTAPQAKTGGFSTFQHLALLDSLKSAVESCVWKAGKTEWGDYYRNTNYSDVAFVHKKEIVAAQITRLQPKSLADLGANDGTFSRLASERGIFTLAFDIDPVAVNLNYKRAREGREAHILPLLQNLSSPSPAIGWHNRERSTFTARVAVDCVLALALIHHLAISNNVPLPQLADFFADLAPSLVIEFVPKEDSKVQKLLATRPDTFPDYTVEGFETAFSRRFALVEKHPIRESSRCIYVMKRLG